MTIVPRCRRSTRLIRSNGRFLRRNFLVRRPNSAAPEAASRCAWEATKLHFASLQALWS
jgi:hypothetical protein